MRILLVNQFFWPDQSATSQLLTDVAWELVERGHDVTVVCASSSYTPGDMARHAPPVDIQRSFAFRFARGRLARLSSYGSFLIMALWRLLFAPKQDLVLTLTTPPLISVLGTLMKRWRGSRHWIWEMDVYPDVATELGWLRRGSLLERAVGAIADWSRGNADGVLVLGDCMKQRLIGRGIPSHLLRVVHNWADGQQITPTEFRREEKLNILYSGNLGLAHDVDTVRDAIRVLSGDPVQFVFAGGGFYRQQLEAWAKEERLSNIAFRGYAPQSDLGSHLGACDVGLVTQNSASLGTVVPSKIYGLMASGRPILYIGPRGSTAQQIIEQYGCGWHIDCGDVSSLVACLRTLNRNRHAVEKAGDAARRAFTVCFDRPIGVARIADALGIYNQRRTSSAIPLMEAGGLEI